MLTIAEDALDLIREKAEPVVIEAPTTLRGCCFGLSTCPDVRFGEPPPASSHAKRILDGVDVYLPKGFPEGEPLVIRTRTRFGRQSLMLDGWRLV